MAVAAQGIPIHRADVHGWIDDYNHLKHPADTLEGYIHKQVSKLELDDAMVDTTAHDSLADETHIADLIVMDLPSYATDN